jgi:hypothetical protein
VLVAVSGPTIPRMNVREAKDFLVNQTAEQAALDSVPLSDLEKRMMYFTESNDSCEDLIAFNGESETEVKSEEYEPKIARLLKHAHKGIKNESPEKRQQMGQRRSHTS